MSWGNVQSTTNGSFFVVVLVMTPPKTRCKKKKTVLAATIKSTRQGLTSNIAATNATHRLLADVVVGAHQQAHKDRDGSLLDHHAGVVAGAASDVGQRPGGLELQRRVVISLEELDELRHNAGVNHVLDRRVALWERCRWEKQNIIGGERKKRRQQKISETTNATCKPTTGPSPSAIP